jgi:voltage-gated potassium channel
MGWRGKIHEIIYEADTPLGKGFDIMLFVLIIISVILVMLESVGHIDERFHDQLLIMEWIITIFFSVEYIARIISIRKPLKYIFSFYGIIDFISTIPLYVSLFVTGTQVLLAVRVLRLLRVFRILKLVQFIGEASQLGRAIRASRAKIAVFIYFVLIMSVIMGSVMYMVEGADAGFTSIPRSVYWAIVTLTTVGYGDIAPQTPLGQLIATIIMIMGYGVIAVPTGIVTTELAKDKHGKTDVHVNTQACHTCSAEGHRDDAIHCYNCGSNL